MDVRLPDGTIVRGVPDNITQEQLTTKLKANGYSFDEPKPQAASAQPPSAVDGVLSNVARYAKLATLPGIIDAATTSQGRSDLGNAVAGSVRGAGSLGATILAPYDMARDAAAGKGASLESNRQRRADMTSALKDLGADPNSAAFGLGQTATEVAGSLGAGGAVAKGLQAALPAAVKSAPAVNALINAIESGGFTTGARAAPGLASQAADIGIRSAGGAVNGLVSAGLVNPQDAGQGAAVGAVLPGASKLLGSAAKTAGSAVSGKLAAQSATDKIIKAVGPDNVQQTVADIQTYYPKGAENIPVSAAGITRSPQLAQLEQGSRLNSAPTWHDFDQRQGKAVFDNVMDATKEADQMQALKDTRRQNWDELWSKAQENQKPRLWVQRMTQFGADMEQAMRSPEASNPQVRAVLEEINREFDRVGPDFSPAHLQTIRANLNGKLQPNSPNVFASAPRDNPAIISLKQELDDILNTSTGGKWQKVLSGYAQDSQDVHAAAAAGKVRDSFIDAATGRVRGVSLDPNGDVPRVTEAGLGRAMDTARMPDKSLALSPEASQKLDVTMAALRRQGMVQGLKRTATAGGGSDAISNDIASGIAEKAGAPNMLLQLLGAVRKLGTGRTQNELARLLSNPDDLAAALDTWLKPQAPNRLAIGLSRSAPSLTAADR